tara:strand:- start:1041 stop:1370 length:330 start_codon:yes stop_codon:yes gene_type:complete
MDSIALINKAYKKSGLKVADHIEPLYCEAINSIEAQHVLRELKRTKANTKRIIQIGVEYGAIDEYLKKQDMEAFHAFVLTVDVNDLQNDDYSPNKYKAAFTEMMELLND